MATDYGYDIAGVEDSDAEMSENSGTILLAQSIARRLITPRGGLIDDPNYGYDVRRYLNDDVNTKTITEELSAAINAECVKDERVLSAVTTGTFVGGVLTLSIAVTPNDGATFKLVLAVSDVTVDILKAS